MIRQRVLIDIEFAVDEAPFKMASLLDDETGVADVTDAEVRERVTGRLIEADWALQGLLPRRSRVTTRTAAPGGGFLELVLPADAGVVAG